MARLLLALLLVSLMLPTGARAESSQWQVLLGGDDANTPRMPSGLAIDAQGSIYVVDTGGSRVEQLTPHRPPHPDHGPPRHRRRWPAPSARYCSGQPGHTPKTKATPGPACQADREPAGFTLALVLVADTANHRIQRFSTQRATRAMGVHCSGPGEFILPTSLAFDSQSNLYVADTRNHRVQELDPDGRPLAAWGAVHFPHGIAVDIDILPMAKARGFPIFRRQHG